AGSVCHVSRAATLSVGIQQLASGTTQVVGPIESGPCPGGPIDCLEFTSTGSGFTVQGRGSGTSQVGTTLLVAPFQIPVVDANGAPAGTRTIVCLPDSTGHIACNASVLGAFPLLGGTVTVTIPTTQTGALAACAGIIGQTCQATLSPATGSNAAGSATGTVISSMQWTVTLNGLPPGQAIVVFQTTAGFETIPCASSSGGTTTCQGTTTGNALQGGLVFVVVNGVVVAQGQVTGPGV